MAAIPSCVHGTWDESDREFVKDLRPAEMDALQRLATVFNTSLSQFIRIASSAENANSTPIGMNDIRRALLDMATEYGFWPPSPSSSSGGSLESNNSFMSTAADWCPPSLSSPQHHSERAQPFVILGLICSVLMIVVAIFGIVGNAISVWFFGRLSTKSSINTMLTAMAVFDCVLLVTGAPLYSLISLQQFHTGYDMLRSFSCCLIYFYTISTMSQTATAWMLVLITFERYIAVCRPFLARRLCTLGRARKAVLAVSALAIAYNAVRLWEYENDRETGEAKPLLRNDPYYKSIYMHWMYLTLVFLIPFSVIAFFNALIIRTIRAARIGRRTCRVHAGARSTNSNHSGGGGQTSNRLQSEHRTAAMLLVVVLVFMLCEVLAPILNALEMAGQPTDRPVFAFFSDLNNLLILVHSTVNVGIYVGFCSEFRRVCHLLLPLVKRLFCCYRSKLIGTHHQHRTGGDSMMEFSTVVAVSQQHRRPLGSVSSVNGFGTTAAITTAASSSIRVTKIDSFHEPRGGGGAEKKIDEDGGGGRSRRAENTRLIDTATRV